MVKAKDVCLFILFVYFWNVSEQLKPVKFTYDSNMFISFDGFVMIYFM
jgi:hypothetical protein